MRKRKMYLSVEDVAEVFDISVSFAYRVVERMNADLANKNYYVILGRVPTREYSGWFYISCPVIWKSLFRSVFVHTES